MTSKDRAIAARWRARLAIRRGLLKAAQARLAHAERGLRWAKANHRPTVKQREKDVAELRHLVAKRKGQVGYATRVVKRHSAASSLSARGLAFIARFEGFRSRAYKPVPGERYWTIGYGHYGPDVKAGERISRAHALALLRRDAKVASAAVRGLHLRLTQGQYDALVSIVFNCGAGVIGHGHTLGDALRRGDMRAAADAFLLYDHGAGGKRLAGLTRRRREERARFLSG